MAVKMKATKMKDTSKKQKQKLPMKLLSPC